MAVSNFNNVFFFLQEKHIHDGTGLYFAYLQWVLITGGDGRRSRPRVASNNFAASADTFERLQADSREPRQSLEHLWEARLKIVQCHGSTGPQGVQVPGLLLLHPLSECVQLGLVLRY
jgi:hypothetical protein